MSNSTTTTNTGADNNTGFGAKLMTARKKKSMSVDDVAQELNILKRHVEALESQSYDELPQFAFARGFVGNYARLVGLPVEEIVKEFENAYPKNLKADSVETIKPPVQPMGTVNRGRTPVKFNVGLIVGIIALILLALGILKLVSGTKTSTATPSETTAQVADGLTATDQAKGASVDGATTAVGTTVPVGNAGSTLATTPTTSATPSTQTAGAEGLLDIWIKEKTVITIKDATGAVLLTGEQGRGGHNLKGVAPFSVEIDNPNRVNIDFNKNPVNMKTYGNTKATLTLQ